MKARPIDGFGGWTARCGRSMLDARRMETGVIEGITMKNDTHPTYYPSCKVYYNGEVVMTVGATVPELKVDVWSGSHPFFTGKATFVDAAGRVEKFQKKFAGNYFKSKK